MEFGLLINFPRKVQGDTLNAITAFFLAAWKFPIAAHHKMNSVMLMDTLLFHKMKA